MTNDERFSTNRLGDGTGKIKIKTIFSPGPSPDASEKVAQNKKMYNK